MTTQRPQLRDEAFVEAPRLKRPLNDALAALATRLDALELAAGLVVLPPVDIALGTVVNPSTTPFPVRVGVPRDFTPAGLLLLRLEPLSGSPPSNVPTGAVSMVWRPTQSDSVEVLYVAGLSASSSYRLTLGALRG